jgi:N-acyl-phosphatidylethanolamine-hydrolysing phospholipase D
MQAVHASPEDAIEIARAVRASKTIGMHWGTIMLTPEDPFEAPLRFRQAAEDQGYGSDNALILKIGETRAFPAKQAQVASRVA